MTQKPEQQCTGCGATVTQDEEGVLRDSARNRFCPARHDWPAEESLHRVELPSVEKCSFSIGDTVRWMGQDGPKVGTVRKITHPENAGFVLWIGDGEMEDFPLVESQASVALPLGNYPPIPDYIQEPIVFRDANLGVAMIGTWNDQQWIFAVHPAGKWITIRRANSSDPLFIDPINKAACPGCENENAPHLTSCRVPIKPSKFDPSCEITKAMPVSPEFPPVAIKPEAAPLPLKWDRQISVIWQDQGTFAGSHRGFKEIACDVEPEFEPLFAAAPEMLAALKALTLAYGASDGRNGNSGECWDLCRAAIAKAEGHQVSCLECGKPIPYTVGTCPHCGKKEF